MAKYRFTGSYENLQALLAPAGLTGEWRAINENLKQFRAEDGAILNYFDSTGTVSFQGPDVKRDALAARVAPFFEATKSAASRSPSMPALNTATTGAAAWASGPADLPTTDGQPVPLVPATFVELGQKFSTSEAVIGLVGAVGTDLNKIAEYIKQRLENAYSCQASIVKVSGDVISKIFNDPVPTTGEYDRIDTLMTRGNDARRMTEDNAILALGVAAAICEERYSEKNGLEHRPRQVYIVNSLKRPEEVTRLRGVYPNGFYLLGVHADEKSRIRDLHEWRNVKLEQAESLIKRDARERSPHGQLTGETFHLSDFFIHLGDSEQHWHGSIERILELLFANPHQTPLFDEFAMFMAFSASLRSGDMSRQVGAVIARDREIIATGANDCPQFGGGLYWPHRDPTSGKIVDVADGRDYTRDGDANKAQVRKIIDNIVEAFGGTGDETTRLREVLASSDLDDITEFGRVVHAEMEALLCCARNNVTAKGATLYCTTFPCHNCAKHIIAAGISRVVFVEPYPKSKAVELHSDGISLGFYDDTKQPKTVIFEPFVGVGPRRFFDLFSMKLGSGFPVKRKTEDDRKALWNRETSRLRVQMHPFSYLNLELEAADQFGTLITKAAK